MTVLDAEDAGPEAGMSSLLLLAAKTGRHKAVLEILAAGGNISARDQEGNTPLLIAATFNHTKVARILLRSGADIDEQNDKGEGTLLPCLAQPLAPSVQHPSCLTRK